MAGVSKALLLGGTALLGGMVLWVVNTARFASNGYSEILGSERRRQRLYAAKQVGVEAMKYVADHHGVLPGPPGPPRSPDYVEPGYAKAMDSFAWAYPGGKLSEIGDPAHTELGRIPDPDGDAVLYADGSVNLVQPR